jgi:hypothetical protein
MLSGMSMAIRMNVSSLILPFGHRTGLSPSRQLTAPEAPEAIGLKATLDDRAGVM